MCTTVKSRSRIFRDVKRMTKFLETKNIPSKSLKMKIVQQDTISIAPKTKLLSIRVCASTDIPPDKYAHVRLSRSSLCSIDIPPAPAIPRPYLHPYIVEASKMLYGKPPWELSAEQAEHFEGYQEYKIRNGRPIEEDICYKPRDL